MGTQTAIVRALYFFFLFHRSIHSHNYSSDLFSYLPFPFLPVIHPFKLLDHNSHCLSKGHLNRVLSSFFDLITQFIAIILLLLSFPTPSTFAPPSSWSATTLVAESKFALIISFYHHHFFPLISPYTPKGSSVYSPETLVNMERLTDMSRYANVDTGAMYVLRNQHFLFTTSHSS